MKYDESDNLLIRATRTVTDKLGDIFRKYPDPCNIEMRISEKHFENKILFFSIEDVFSQSDMAKTLAEITKIDPSFNKDNFLHECEYEIIPTVLQVSNWSTTGATFCFSNFYGTICFIFLGLY
jgi:import inner membrane translocase subunit TIM44